LPKRWFGNENMTSYCDFTNSAQTVKMTTVYTTETWTEDNNSKNSKARARFTT